MDYLKQYEVLVANARENPSVLPGENHHVVPRSIHRFMPSAIAVNAPENLVFLSHQEHLMAHYLLWKMWEGREQYGASMAAAFRLMMDISKVKPTPQQLDEYANAKEANRVRMSGGNHPSSIKVRSLRTGKLFDSMTIASESFGHCLTTARVECHRNRESMLNGKYKLGSKSRWFVYEEDFQKLLNLAGLTESSLEESVTRKTPSFHKTWGYLLRKHNPTWLLNS